MEPAKRLDRYDAKVQSFFYEMYDKHQSRCVVEDLFEKCFSQKMTNCVLESKQTRLVKRITKDPQVLIHVKEVVKALLHTLPEDKLELEPIEPQKKVELSEDKASILLAQQLEYEFENEALAEKERQLEKDRKLALQIHNREFEWRPVQPELKSEPIESSAYGVLSGIGRSLFFMPYY